MGRGCAVPKCSTDFAKASQGTYIRRRRPELRTQPVQGFLLNIKNSLSSKTIIVCSKASQVFQLQSSENMTAMLIVRFSQILQLKVLMSVSNWFLLFNPLSVITEGDERKENVIKLVEMLLQILSLWCMCIPLFDAALSLQAQTLGHTSSDCVARLCWLRRKQEVCTQQKNSIPAGCLKIQNHC